MAGGKVESANAHIYAQTNRLDKTEGGVGGPPIDWLGEGLRYWTDMMYSKYTGFGEASLLEKIGMVGCICDRGGTFDLEHANRERADTKWQWKNDRFVKG